MSHKMKKASKPKNYSLKASIKSAIGTLYIIALFMLITLGLPLILPGIISQVLTYATIFIILFIYNGRSI